MDNNDIYTWDKRIKGNGLNEPSESYEAFLLWLENKSWNLKDLSKETGINYNKLKKWSSKYKYKERRTAKEKYEFELINLLNIESKLITVKESSNRLINIQKALNMFSNHITDLILNMDNLNLDLNDIERLNKILFELIKSNNQCVLTAINLDEMINNIELLKEENSNVNSFLKAFETKREDYQKIKDLEKENKKLKKKIQTLENNY